MIEYFIKKYKQITIILIAVVLGFIIGFTTKWANEPISKTGMLDYLVSIGLTLSIVILIVVLYRMSRINFLKPRKKQNNDEHHCLTSIIFIVGIFLAYIGIVVSIFQEKI